jgi:tetraacyldisaccharide 4'-kinase
LNLLSASYARAARLRRTWYEYRPELRRSLDRPVVSVGNLAVGGSGKTPVVAALARLLLEMGERPSILSRGYGRRRWRDGVVVASDGVRVLEPVERTGDEPQMLARMLSGVPVLVSPDRHVAGRIAERRLACTVHVLDDGFQHFALGRHVDLVLLSRSDMDERVLPVGRLREGLDAASSADCLLVPGADEDVASVAAAFDRMPVFKVATHYAPIRVLDRAGEAAAPPAGAPVVAVAGIARPERFFKALGDLGYAVTRQFAFRDHHRYSGRDLDRIATAAREAGVDLVVTTEKDAVRVPAGCAWGVLPMTVSLHPADSFREWLRDRL